MNKPFTLIDETERMKYAKAINAIGCEECWFLTECYEERTYCPECAADVRDATELAFVEATTPGANADAMTRYTELAAELKAIEEG